MPEWQIKLITKWWLVYENGKKSKFVMVTPHYVMKEEGNSNIKGLQLIFWTVEFFCFQENDMANFMPMLYGLMLYVKM